MNKKKSTLSMVQECREDPGCGVTHEIRSSGAEESIFPFHYDHSRRRIFHFRDEQQVVLDEDGKDRDPRDNGAYKRGGEKRERERGGEREREERERREERDEKERRGKRKRERLQMSVCEREREREREGEGEGER